MFNAANVPSRRGPTDRRTGPVRRIALATGLILSGLSTTGLPGPAAAQDAEPEVSERAPLWAADPGPLQTEEELARDVGSLKGFDVDRLELAGVRFRLSLDASTSAPAASAQSPFVVRDPTLLDGEWSWVGDQHGKLNYRPHGHPSSASGTDRSHDP